MTVPSSLPEHNIFVYGALKKHIRHILDSWPYKIMICWVNKSHTFRSELDPQNAKYYESKLNYNWWISSGASVLIILSNVRDSIFQSAILSMYNPPHAKYFKLGEISIAVY